MSSVGRFHVLLLLFLFSLLFSDALQSGGINVRSVLLDLSLIKNPYSSALTGWNSTISSEYSRRLRYIATLNSCFSRLLKYLPSWATAVQVFLDMVPAESTNLKFEIIHEIVSFSLLLTVKYLSNPAHLISTRTRPEVSVGNIQLFHTERAVKIIIRVHVC